MQKQLRIYDTNLSLPMHFRKYFGILKKLTQVLKRLYSLHTGRVIGKAQICCPSRRIPGAGHIIYYYYLKWVISSSPYCLEMLQRENDADAEHRVVIRPAELFRDQTHALLEAFFLIVTFQFCLKFVICLISSNAARFTEKNTQSKNKDGIMNALTRRLQSNRYFETLAIQHQLQIYFNTHIFCIRSDHSR